MWLAAIGAIFAAGSFNQTELVYVDPAFAIVMADEGTMLPPTPEVQFNVRARYEFHSQVTYWPTGSYKGMLVSP